MNLIYFNNNNNLNLKLRLTGDLFFGGELIITPNGLINSIRNHNDGQTFFGINNSKDYTGTYYNDFVINYPFENDELRQYGQDHHEMKLVLSDARGKAFEVLACQKIRRLRHGVHPPSCLVKYKGII